MHFTDQAIVLATRKHAESSAIVRVLMREHGAYAGVVRGANGKSNRGLWQPGNGVLVTWKARLPEHMGMLTGELLEPVAAHVLPDAARLAALSSACTLTEMLAPERHPYPQLYTTLLTLAMALKDDDAWMEAYCRFELELLASCGFRLDLSRCAATGSTENLVYVSPKSARAVSAEAGAPYKEKLLKLPAFLLSPPPAGGRAREGVNFRKPNRYGSHALIAKARELRGEMTEAEKKIWYHLRAHRFDGYSFRRQHPVSEYYIVDFVCLDKKLVIELDGGGHAEQVAYDTERTAFLEAEGYRVLRFWNNAVFENMESVLESILDALKAAPSLTLPPTGGGDIDITEILDSLRLTGYFLDRWLLAPHEKRMPAARNRLVKALQEQHIILVE